MTEFAEDKDDSAVDWKSRHFDPERFPLTPDTHLYESVPLSKYVPVDRMMFEEPVVECTPDNMLAFIQDYVESYVCHPPYVINDHENPGTMRIVLKDGLGSVVARDTITALKMGMQKVARDNNPGFTMALNRRLKGVRL